MSLRGIARAAGVSRSWLQRFVNGLLGSCRQTGALAIIVFYAGPQLIPLQALHHPGEHHPGGLGAGQGVLDGVSAHARNLFAVSWKPGYLDGQAAGDGCQRRLWLGGGWWTLV
jgi:hypothetical protein